MSIFGSIMSKIFGQREAAVAVPPGSAAPDAMPGEEAVPPPGAEAAPPPRPEATPDAAARAPSVDVAAILTSMAAQSPQKLDGRRSIVDLMKLLGLDSSLGGGRTSRRSYTTAGTRTTRLR
jgi:Domain of unknown function (DUF3597)